MSVVRPRAALAVRLHQCICVTSEDLVLGAPHEGTTPPSALSQAEGTLQELAREVLAQRVGCTRVKISRALSRLVDGG